MENVELVIKIPKEDYERLKIYKKAPFCSFPSRVYEAVANGTPLPEHHGDLKDVGEVIAYCDNKINENVVKTHNYPIATAYDNVKQELIDLLPIIPATKEGEDTT